MHSTRRQITSLQTKLAILLVPPNQTKFRLERELNIKSGTTNRWCVGRDASCRWNRGCNQGDRYGDCDVVDFHLEEDQSPQHHPLHRHDRGSSSFALLDMIDDVVSSSKAPIVELRLFLNFLPSGRSFRKGQNFVIGTCWFRHCSFLDMLSSDTCFSLSLLCLVV
ncbi:unnamed protein product [Brassica napus]|uniref:(rape) hypothetical protein n=2 Tax=Brassica TaxID=3705 RepID=A0A816LEP1_BRANA|nr:unnamed protein product [Brassica napus]